MFKNSILYHRWWYIKKRNIKKIRMLLRLTLAAMIMWLVFIFTQGSIFTIFGF